MTVALIVPVLKRFDLFTELIHSVDYPIHPIIMDNWNDNRGVSSAWNNGMVIAKKNKFDYAIISNDDVVFRKDTIKKLHDSIAMNEHVVIGADQIEDRENNGLINETHSDVYFSPFACFAVNLNKLILKCGYFDENFYPAYFEDNDMRRRIELAGLTIKINTDAKIFHHGSATQNPNKNNIIDNWAVKPAKFEENRLYYVKKWGGMPGEEKFSTPFNDPNLTLKDW